MSRFLRFCAFLSVLFFTGNLMAAGYTCSTTGKYTSCKEGYYMSDCGSTAANWTGQTVSATSGNSCIACPGGYTCKGDNVCPVRNGINCAAGTYIKANTTTCTACPARNYCPGITTDSVTSTSSDRGITQCPEGSYCPAGSSSPKSCPTNYGNSAAGSDAEIDCYTRCGAGAVVTVPKTACTTPAGAWYYTTEHVVSYGSISSVAYCPYGSDSRNGVTSLHDQAADCLVTVPAGYSSAVTPSTARYIRISSETGAFPLAEIQAYNSSTKLSLALGSSMTSGANALDDSLITQAGVSTGSAVGAYATFDLGSAKTITNIRFALGNVTSGYKVVIAISSDNSNWTTVFNQTIYGVSALPGVMQNVPLNTRINTKCAAGTYQGATTVLATNGVTCTECPKAICNGETNCASGFSTHRNTYPANYHSGDNLKLVKTWFATASNTGNKSIEECKLSYTYTNNRGTFNQDAVRYQSSTGRYDGVGGTVYYTVLNPGYYGSGKMQDGYCDIDTNSRRHYYQDAVVCPAGKYCSGYTQMPLCSSGTYNDTMGIDGLLSGGYFSTGGAKKATPTSADCVGVVGADIWSSSAYPVKNVCGQLLPGYYSKEGAILPAPGELGAKNTAALGFNIDYLNQGLDSVRAGCLGGSNKCGMVDAGFFASGAATSSRPSSSDCLTGTCGICPAGSYSAAGATTCTACPALTSGWEYVPLEGGTSYTSCQQYATPNGCAAGKVAVKAASTTAWQPLTAAEPYSWATSDSVLTANPGYYRTSSTSVTCTVCPGGTYSTGGKVSSCTKISAGYFSSGAATSSTPSSADCVTGTCGICEKGTYSDAGATSCSSCPALGGSNWTWDMLKGAKKYSECKRTGVPDGCSAGTVTDTATMDTTTSAIIWGKRVITEWAAPGNAQILAQRGYQIDVTNLKCTICPSGHYSGGATGSCWPVAAGYYATGAATEAKPSSSDCVTGTCGKVQANCFGASGATSACPNKCKDVANGTYPQSQEGADSVNKCYISGSTMGGGYIATAGGPRRDCPLGTYNDFHTVYYGQTSRCTVCPSGTTTTTQGAHNTSSASCDVECTNGYGVYEWQMPELSSDGGTVLNLCQVASCKKGRALWGNQCNECPQGQYQSIDGYSESMCSITPAGYYNNETGATEPVPCPAGQWSRTQSTSCSILPAGYWNTGCGTDESGAVCTEDYDGGEIAAGYWGEDGATESTGSGLVNPGYYSTGGGTSATPTAAGNGCVSGNQCGVVDAGYYSTGGATTPQGQGQVQLGLYSTCGATADIDRSSEKFLSCVEGCECGMVAAGYYATAGGTSAQGTCIAGNECGTIAPGYYSRGGSGFYQPSGHLCWGYNRYSDGVNGCGQVGAGYWNNGGGTDVNGTCVSGKSCGLIDAGYFSAGGATTSTGAGEVNGGFFSTGGGKTATPASNSDCAGDSTTCGKIAAGYWSYRGGKTATPTSSADCTMGYCGVIRGGYYSTCGGIEEYATAGSVNSCADGCECGPINPGYYSTGCSISDDGAVCDTSKYTVGEIVAGYYSDGGSNTPQGDGLLAAGYFSTGGATVRKPTSADCVGSNTCGTVNAGYYVSGGGTLAAPVAFGNGCVGQWKNNAGEMVNHACGKVGAGYWNNGGGTDVNGTCVSGKSCGLIDAGYFSTGGATVSTPTAAADCVGSDTCGKVWPGHFSTGGATKQKPTAADCVEDNECGLVDAGYWTSWGGRTKTPANAETDCVNKDCGVLGAGYYSTGGATRRNPTEIGNHCFGTSCGLVGAGYYSSGGGTSATPTAVGNGCLTGFVCGGCPTGYDDNTAQGKTAVDQCQISCAAGTRVAARNAACTSPAGGWFSAATLTSYGNVSPVSYCMDGYTSTSTSASGHDAATDCVQTIAGGKYVPSSKINARYVKMTGNIKNSVNNYGVHVVEMQAFASNDGTGTNLMADSTSDKTTDDDWTTSSHVGISTAKTWDLGSVQSLGSLKFALYPGRTYYNVAIYVSEDNTNWTTVFGPQDVLTQSISPLVGEVVVLSAAPKSCAAGTYKASGSLALTNTSSCDAAQAGYFVGTTGASSQTKCVMGSYTDATGQSACKACAGGKTNSEDGATSCTATCSNATGVASTGWETPVWGTDNKMTNLCTIKATAGCSANYYKNSNACATCASGTNSKYTLSAAGTTTVNDCYLEPTATKYVVAAGQGLTTCAENGYCPGSTAANPIKIYYGGTHSSTHLTTGGRTACSGSYTLAASGSDDANDCYLKTTAGQYVQTAGAGQKTCPAEYWCVGNVVIYKGGSVTGRSTTGGSEQCPAGYRDGTTGYSLQSQCTMNVLGGKYVEVVNESSASGKCGLGTYKPAHTVTYGETSSCIPCPNATYADQEGMSACEACPTATKYADKVVSYGSNKKARSTCFARFEDTVKNGETTYFSCYLRSGDDYGTLTSGRNCWTHGARTKCDAGYYSPVVPSADYDEMWYMNYSTVVNNLCMPVESGYWSGADSLTRTACATGLVTCGAGLCANEAGDCGRKLHAGDNVIYLRSEKRTGVSPLLHVKMKMEDASGKEVDRLFYGNMSTTLSGPLKVKYNNTKYSVVNDNQ